MYFTGLLRYMCSLFECDDEALSKELAYRDCNCPT